jgi:hypothetical protein
MVFQWTLSIPGETNREGVVRHGAIKYFRILVHLFLTATGISAGIWTMLRGYRWPLPLILVAHFATSMLVLPRPPNPITPPITTRRVLTRWLHFFGSSDF